MTLSAFNNIIYIADEIHSDGCRMLLKAGFKLVELYGLTNDVLIDNIIKLGNKDSYSVLIIRSVRNIDRKVIDRLYIETSIRLICTASSGFDNIDTAYAYKKKMEVFNVPDGNFISAAEHTMAVILAVMKSINRADKDMKSGIFNAGRYENRELLSKTIGIIGVGRVGSHVAKLSRAFGMNVIGNDINKSLLKKYPWIKFTKLENLLTQSDIVTIHTPLDGSTFNLINRGNIKLLKGESILINCARGGIVNEIALLNHLNGNRLFYAGVDVFMNEPDILEQFKDLDNLIITPHLAGKTKESKLRISIQLAERIIGYSRKMKNNAKNSNLKN